jgi:copper homeostasis protein
MTSKLLLEVCVDSVEGCLSARAGGADRVELCASLVEGGTTPSGGMLAAARGTCSIPMMVMIRPRGGDFLYSQHEFQAMREDIAGARAVGARGVVLGILRADGTVDEERTRELVDRARPLEVCFHRAFDMTRDPFEALETLVQLGVERVLTSGQEKTAIDGLARIAGLVRAAAGRIVVMPGGGVREDNIRRVIDATGAREVHVSLRTPVSSTMLFRNPRCTMSSSAASAEYEHSITDVQRVRRCVEALHETTKRVRE